MIANLYGRGKNMGNNMISKEKGELVKEIDQLLQVPKRNVKEFMKY